MQKVFWEYHLFNIVKSDSLATFKRNSKPKRKLVLMDGYRRQKCATALAAVSGKMTLMGKFQR